MTLLVVEDRECGRSTDGAGSPRMEGSSRRIGVGEIISTGSSVMSRVSGAGWAPLAFLSPSVGASITGPNSSSGVSPGSSALCRHPLRRLASSAIGERFTASVRGTLTDSVGVSSSAASLDVMFESRLMGCCSSFCCISVDGPRSLS